MAEIPVHKAYVPREAWDHALHEIDLILNTLRSFLMCFY